VHHRFLPAFLRRRSAVTALMRSTAMGVALVVALTPELAQATQLPFPQQTPRPSAAHSLAAGLSHDASADSTKAGGGSGHAPGQGQGELGKVAQHSKTVKTGPSVKAAAPIANVATSAAAVPDTSSFDPVRSTRRKDIGDDRSVVFQNPDGTNTVHAYQDRVQFKDASGAWTPIDDTLKASASGRLSRAADSLNSQFASTAADPALMSLATDAAHEVTFSLAGAASAAAAVSGDTATYAQVAPSSDLVLKATADGTKETLVLRDASAPTTWVFPYSAKGVTASQDKATGDIVFTDASGTVVMRVPHGEMADSNVDPKSHDAAWSNGVTYALTSFQGAPALQVSLDASWLKDSARKFPVFVDPTTLNASSSTFVETVDSTGNNESSPVLKVGTFDNGVHKAVSYLGFSNLHSTFQNDWVRGAWLHLYDVWSSACTPENVYVNSMTGSWNVDTISDAANGYPGAPIGFQVGQQAFTGGTNCSSGPVWQRVGLNPGYFDNYAHGATFYGLAVTADTGSTTTSWKQFASNASGANTPYLEIDYSPYGVKWTGTPSWSTVPTATTDGVLQVPLENWGNTTWTPTNGYQLRYTLSNANTGAVLASANTSMPGNVAPQQSATVAVTVAHQAAGTPLKLTLDMVAPGGITFSSWLAPTEAFTYTGANIAPQIDGMAPPSNTTQPSLTPTLWAAGHDPDNYPSPVQFGFWVCPVTGANCTSSGWLSAGINAWTVPAGALKWDQSYYWYTEDYDGSVTSAPSQPDWFSTAVGQPVITSHLAQNSNEHGFDPESGNYTTAATDLTVAGSGLPLQVQRTYNSLDPRFRTAFGASWSSVFDMTAVPDCSYCTNSDVVVTYPNGQQVRFGRNADGSFTAPPGRFAQLTANGNTGYTLVDKDGTTYTFIDPYGGSIGASVYYIGSIADHAGHSETFTWTVDGQPELSTVTSNVSGRSLHFIWATPTGATWAHVSKIYTDPVSGTDQNTDVAATYSYTGDQLTGTCLPSLQSQCTGYGYATGSHGRSAVMDADPESFWRLADAAGSTTAASEVIANEGSDTASATGVGFGAAGVNATSTAGTFDGTSSAMQLPNGLVEGGTFLTIQMWFKTTASGSAQMLFSTGHDPANASNPSSGAMPVLYVGTDGQLHGHFWDGTVAGMSPPCTVKGVNGTCMNQPPMVNDGAWHQVTLTASGSSQTLYLDGQSVASETGQLTNIDPYDIVGAGVFNSNGWPAAPGGNVWSHFNGQIADVAFYNKPLNGGQIAQQWAAAKTPAALLNGITLPSGKTAAAMNYDTHADRLTSVTDINGGTYKVGAPSVSGTSALYRSAVLGASPAGYWRLGDQPGAAQAFDELDNDGADATYNGVALGVSSVFNDATGASFDGSSSYLQIPNTVAPTSGAGAVSTWFKTSGSGVILNYQSAPLGTANPTGAMWVTAYVGTDGILRGGFFTTSGSEIMSSPSKVNDGKWHHVVLSGAGTSQALYLDGKQINQATTGTPITTVTQPYAYIGAGTTGTSWPGLPNLTDVHFNGSIADFAFYQHQLSAQQVSAMWGAAQSASGAAPTTKVEVTDPNGNPLDYTYDPYNGGRLITSSDAKADVTSYGYDTGGFLNTVTDPNGDITTTGHDVRGNVVSRTTCQNVLANKCATAFYTYWPDDTSTTLSPDPRNDQMTSSRDGRSANAIDPTYATTYSYDRNGNLTATTTPPVAGSPSGRTTTTVYTVGTEAAADSGTVPPGLVASTTTPAGAKTTYTYLHNGDVASITDGAGQVTKYVAYDGLGRVLNKTVFSDTFPNGLATTYTYDAAGRVLTETDPGVTDRVTGKVHTKVTTTGYDPDGNALTVAVSDATGGDLTRTTTNTWDASDHLESITDPAGAVTSYKYDAFGNKAKQIDAVGTETDYAYDPRGKLTTVTLHNYTGDPVNPSPATDLVQSSRSYDPAGRLGKVTDSLGRTTSYAYFDDGHLATVTVSPDSTGAGGTVVDNRSYDLAGNLISESKGDGQASSVYTVDAANRDAVIADQYSTDSSGNPLYRTTTTTFDPDDHPVSVSKAQQGSATVETVDFTYDPLGRKTSQTIHDSTPAQTSAAGLAGSWPLADATTVTAADSSATPTMKAPIQVPMDGRTYSASAAQTWTSSAVRLTFQPDGNLVAYRTSDGVAIWNSATAGHPTATLALQTDGNLVINSAASGGTVLWATATSNNPGDVLQLADNGDFTVTNTNGTRLWAAGTAQPGYNHPGALHGGVSWSADQGGSAAFDGTSGSITAGGPVIDTTKSFTVTAWAKANSNGSLGAVVAQNGTAQAQLLLYADAGSTHNWNFAMGSADTGWNTDWVSSGVAVAPGQWVQLAGVFNAATSTMSIYVNGQPKGSVTHNARIPSSAFEIGQLKSNGAESNNFNGSISGVRAYNRVLADSEISALYTGPTSAQPGQNGLAGAWNLADGKVTAASDASGNNNPGNPSGGVSFSADHNGSALFDGNAGSAITTTGQVVDTTQSFSVSAWVDLSSTAGPNTAVSQDANQDSGFYLQYDKADNKWSFSQVPTDNNPTTAARALSAAAPALNTWTHLVGIYNRDTGGTLTLYVNGQAQGTATNAADIPSTGPLSIGRGKWNGAGTDWLHGKIASVQVYNRALSVADVNTLYSSGNLVTGPTNVLKTTWTLDKRGLPTSMTDPRGNAPGANAAAYTTGYTYDEAGSLAVTTGPTVNAETGGGTATAAHPITTVGYDTFGDQTSAQDPDGNIATAAYDGDGRSTAVTLPNYTAPGSTTAITATTATHFDDLGRPLTLTDPLGNKTAYMYDQLGDVATRTDPAASGTGSGGVWHTAYNTDGEAVTATDPTGAVTQAFYDYLGRTTSVTNVVRQPITANDTTTYYYDALGDLTKTTSPTGVNSTAYYDNLGERTTATDGAGNTTTYGYDLNGRPAWVHNPDGTMRTAGYDLAGRNIWTSDIGTDGSTVLRTAYNWYDLAGNLTASTDPDGVTTNYGYDALNHLVWQDEPVASGQAISTTYGYDAAGNQTRYTDGNGNSWIQTFNSWGKVESQIDPATPAYPNAADRTYTASYDADGNIGTIAEPGGVTLNSTYDNLGRLTKETGFGADAPTAERDLGYDAAGRITSASAPGGTDTFTWDDRNQLLSTAGPSGTSSFAYNAAGQMHSRTDAAGTTVYDYDTAGRLWTISDPLTSTTATYNYNNLDQIKSISYGAGSDTRAFSYDPLHRLTSDTLQTSGGASVASITYGYNNDNQETSKTTTGFAGAAANTYEYDLAGRLTSWNNGTTAIAYGYDKAGNRTQIGSKTLNYNARDQLTSDGTSTYAYTARGTLSTKTPIAGGTAETIASDAFDRTITDSNGSSTYSYDGLDRLIGHGTATTAYSGIGGTIASDGYTQYSYNPEGNLTAFKTSAGASLAYTDQHGDVVAGYSPTGTALGYSIAYDPLGNVLSKVNGTLNLGYQGGWTDQTTGKVSTASRWYDPATGQFTSRDTNSNSPTPSSANANRYGYANDNPLDMTDPSGHGGTATDIAEESCGTAVVDQEVPVVDAATDAVCAGSVLAVAGMQVATIVGGWFGSGWLVGDHKSHKKHSTSSAPTYDPHDFDWLNSTITSLAGDISALWQAGDYAYNHLPKGGNSPQGGNPPNNGNSPQGGTGQIYLPPPPPTPAEVALIPAKRPGPSRLGDGSGITHSIQKIVDVFIAQDVQTANGDPQKAFVPQDASAASVPSGSEATGGTGLGGCSAPMGYQCTANGNYVDLTTGEVICGISSLSANETCISVAAVTALPNADSLVDWVPEGGNLRAGANPGMRPDAYRWQSLTPGARCDADSGYGLAPKLCFADKNGDEIAAKFDGAVGNEIIDRKRRFFHSQKAADETRRQLANAQYYGLTMVYELPNQWAVDDAWAFMQKYGITGAVIRVGEK